MDKKCQSVLERVDCTTKQSSKPDLLTRKASTVQLSTIPLNVTVDCLSKGAGSDDIIYFETGHFLGLLVSWNWIL